MSGRTVTIVAHHCNSCSRDFRLEEIPPQGVQLPNPQFTPTLELSECPLCKSRNIRTVPMEVPER